MTDGNYPCTGFGVEVHTDETGWVLLDGIHRTRAAATTVMQSLTGQHGFTGGDMRVVELTITRSLTITRKEPTE